MLFEYPAALKVQDIHIKINSIRKFSEIYLVVDKSMGSKLDPGKVPFAKGLVAQSIPSDAL